MNRLAASLVALGLLTGPAWAEQTDRDQPMNIQADRAQFNQKESAGTYTGNVIVTQGTMRLTSAQLQVRQDEAGNQYANGSGSPVNFKQRQDSGEWVYAQALRFDYNGKTGILKLMDKAWVRRDNGDEVIGQTITYNMNDETYEADGGNGGGGSGRVNITIQPKKKEAR
ncbi:lipopolysaccharide transport periplasmic protein LptA [Chitiniphilus purpureus]|uniref:Lipopolysaccharide export system protein LptA n=1 Tax=Chitiniphilus purpureus TaxID=2981137 RepID=A0ABY6DLQ6_9NEIS|nr:lipopolysaccharide transport periplasmic protein LptA [Chitiniphilus sp. CD1]UXY15274.1 lipopolysaccharide transport periplasmic protein LptA [Chitiniphilus sp. CD1]